MRYWPRSDVALIITVLVLLRLLIEHYAYHCSWARIVNLGPIPLLFSNDPKGSLGGGIAGNPHTTRPLINQAGFGERVEIK
jgi:hypothetical protein